MDSMTKPHKFIKSLLDDQDFNNSPDARDWEELTFKALMPKISSKPVKTEIQANTIQRSFSKALPSANLHTTKHGTKIFRNRKTFNQLLVEYNGRSNSLTPLKSNRIRSSSLNNKTSSLEFSYDSVEVMEINAPSGKILRPTSIK
jgi:hypothetical protein